MATTMKLRAAGAVAATMGVLAACQGGPGGSAAATVAPTVKPSAITTAAPAAPTVGAYVPPALSGAFTSTRHGLSIASPAGWTASAASKPWTASTPPEFGDPSMDFVYEPTRQDHFFYELGSQPLPVGSFDTWMADFVADEGCHLTRESVIPGADRSRLYEDCYLVTAAKGGRAYVVWMYTSGDDPDLEAFDASAASAWFATLLQTLELHPEAAVDAPAS